MATTTALECIINGKPTSSDKHLDVVSVNGDVIATVPDLGPYSLTQSVMGARKSKKELSRMSYKDICKIFAKAADYYDDRYDKDIALSRGNTLKQVREARENIKQMLINYEKILYNAFSGTFAQTKDVSINKNYYFEPVGIVAIIPSSTTREVAPYAILSALAVGNPVIVKADPKEPFSPLELAKHLYSAGLPEGSLSVLLWDVQEKPELGARLVKLADKSVLFGSDETIKRIAYYSVQGKIEDEVINELPIPRNIVAFGTGRTKSLIWNCDDMENAARMIAHSSTYIPSACLKTQYVVIPEDEKERFIAEYQQALYNLKTGDLLDPKTDVGHTIPQNQKNVNLIIQNAINFGAKMIISHNIYEEPSLFDNVHPESLLIKEETPAPTLGLVTAQTIDDAISLINESVRSTPSRKSLRVAIYTKDKETYFTCLKNIQAYSIIHNRPTSQMSPFEPHQGIYLCRELTVLKGG